MGYYIQEPYKLPDRKEILVDNFIKDDKAVDKLLKDIFNLTKKDKENE